HRSAMSLPRTRTVLRCAGGFSAGLRLLLHEEGQRSGVAVQKILFPDRSDFPVAEETRNADRTEPFLHHFGIMVGSAKQVFPAAVAATETPAINRGTANLIF